MDLEINFIPDDLDGSIRACTTHAQQTVCKFFESKKQDGVTHSEHFL